MGRKRVLGELSATEDGRGDEARPDKLYMSAPTDPISCEAVPEWNHPKCLYENLDQLARDRT